MCDCYAAKCQRCGVYLPVHLADFETKRHEVVVYCAKHLPKRNVRVFHLIEADIYEDMPYIPKVVLFPRGWRMGIRYLTQHARDLADGNFPNVSCDYSTEDL